MSIAALTMAATASKIYLAYLLLGIPGLYTGVRFSEDIVDVRNKKALGIYYVLWLPLLIAVMCENAWSGTKKVFSVFREGLRKLGNMYTRVLQLVAKSAESKKRAALPQRDIVGLLEFLEQ